jgi:hypothetical protein
MAKQTATVSLSGSVQDSLFKIRKTGESSIEQNVSTFIFNLAKISLKVIPKSDRLLQECRQRLDKTGFSDIKNFFINLQHLISI